MLITFLNFRVGIKFIVYYKNTFTN